MKAIMITFDQAHYTMIIEKLLSLNVRGFTAWEKVIGRGSKTGIPHFSTHAWPSSNNAIFTVIDNEVATIVLKELKQIDNESAELGLRAFAWTIDEMI